MNHDINVILRRSQQRFRWSAPALRSSRRLLVVECDGANIDRQRGMLVGRHQGVHGLTPDPQEGRLPLPVALPLLLAGADGEGRAPARVAVGEGPDARGLLDDVIVRGGVVVGMQHQDILLAGDKVVLALATAELQGLCEVLSQEHVLMPHAR